MKQSSYPWSRKAEVGSYTHTHTHTHTYIYIGKLGTQ